jgi:hypothetical protein
VRVSGLTRLCVFFGRLDLLRSEPRLSRVHRLSSTARISILAPRSRTAFFDHRDWRVVGAIGTGGLRSPANIPSFETLLTVMAPLRRYSLTLAAARSAARGVGSAYRAG